MSLFSRAFIIQKLIVSYGLNVTLMSNIQYGIEVLLFVAVYYKIVNNPG